MSTKYPRLNVVLEPPLYNALSSVAHQQGVSLSLIARDLIKEALTLYEDRYWNTIAEQRMKTFSLKKTRTHEDIWK